MNGYRPIVELMNTNFGIYGMAEISSAGNTYATTGGQFDMPLTIIGAGGTAPNQALGAEHSQVMACVRVCGPPTKFLLLLGLRLVSRGCGRLRSRVAKGLRFVFFCPLLRNPSSFFVFHFLFWLCGCPRVLRLCVLVAFQGRCALVLVFFVAVFF